MKKKKKVKKKMMDDDDETKMNTSNNMKMLKMGVNRRRGKNHDVGRRKEITKNWWGLCFCDKIIETFYLGIFKTFYYHVSYVF